VFISWGDGVAPLISASGVPYCDHYLVSRGLMGDGSDGVVIGRTRAEVFLDENVAPSRVYHYRVYAVGTLAATESKDVAHFTVTTKARPPRDLCAPTTPLGLRATRDAQALEWTWCPSQKTPSSRLLGYFVEDSDASQARGFIFEQHGATQKWREPVSFESSRVCRLRAIDKDLNISEPSRVAAGQPSHSVQLQICGIFVYQFFYEPRQLRGDITLDQVDENGAFVRNICTRLDFAWHFVYGADEVDPTTTPDTPSNNVFTNGWDAAVPWPGEPHHPGTGYLSPSHYRMRIYWYGSGAGYPYHTYNALQEVFFTVNNTDIGVEIAAIGTGADIEVTTKTPHNLAPLMTCQFRGTDSEPSLDGQLASVFVTGPTTFTILHAQSPNIPPVTVAGTKGYVFTAGWYQQIYGIVRHRSDHDEWFDV
jgi:hypothetical protein